MRVSRIVQVAALSALGAWASSPAPAATVTVRPGDTLTAIARRAGVSPGALAQANGIVNRNVVVLGRRLVVPARRVVHVARRVVHVVRPGESLSLIARRYHTTVAAIARANGLANRDLVEVGRRLVVPVGAGRSRGAHRARRAATYRVRPGDSLSAIAARVGTPAATLASLNGIADPSLLLAGSLLRLPASAGRAIGFRSHAGFRTHVVVPGDTLAGIAGASGVSVAALQRINSIGDPNVVQLGRVLRIPGSGGGAAGGAAGGATTTSEVVVRPGDTLASLAGSVGTGVGAIITLNHLSDPNLISVGQRLRVPIPASAATAAQVRALIDQEAAKLGVDAALARAVAWQESGYSQRMISGVGAVGVMQVLPATAKWAGTYIIGRKLDVYDVRDNVAAGMAYLRWLLQHAPDTRTAVAGYYQGLSSVQARGMFSDTAQYVDNVLALKGRV